MEKKCLVIMPGGDVDGYPQGHFNRVFEYVIAPACRSADFTPERINDTLAFSGDLLDVFKNVVECGMTICDLSAGNQNVAYAFAIRNVLTLPAVLVKDTKTSAIEAVSDAEVVNYDESLRIDTVQGEISTLTEAIKRAYSNRSEPHALLSQLNFQPIDQKELDKHEDAKEKSMPIISPLPEYVGDPFTQAEMDKLKVGDELFHLTRGRGEITSVKNAGREKIAGISFESGSTVLVLGASDYFRKITS